MGSKSSKVKATKTKTKTGVPLTLGEQYGNGVGPVEEYVLPLPASYYQTTAPVYQTAAPVYQPQTVYAPAPQYGPPVGYATEIPQGYRHHNRQTFIN